MSFQLVQVILQRSPVRGLDRLVLVALASFARNGTGDCYPSVATVAQRAGCSRRTVLNALPRLERAGAIDVVRRHRRVNRYHIATPS